MSDAPYKVTVEYDLWVYGDPNAYAAVEELLAKFAAITTTINGGTTTHHRLVSTKIEKQPR